MALLGIIISCKEFDDFLVSHLDGTLTGRQQLLFNAHIAMCSKCRRYLKQYQQTIVLAKTTSVEKETLHAEAPDDLVHAILQAKKAGSSNPPEN